MSRCFFYSQVELIWFCLSRTKEKLRSGELAVSGDQWPIFLYAGYTYDPEDPWNGLLRSTILVYVSTLIILLTCSSENSAWISQAFKHVFTSPSSVDKEPKATRSGNARLHGMTCVTAGSIAYIATQVGNHSCNGPWTYCDIRFAFLLVPHQYFPARILLPILRSFTPLSSTYLKTLMKLKRSTTFTSGGTGEYLFVLHGTL